MHRSEYFHKEKNLQAHDGVQSQQHQHARLPVRRCLTRCIRWHPPGEGSVNPVQIGSRDQILSLSNQGVANWRAHPLIEVVDICETHQRHPTATWCLRRLRVPALVTRRFRLGSLDAVGPFLVGSLLSWRNLLKDHFRHTILDMKLRSGVAYQFSKVSLHQRPSFCEEDSSRLALSPCS